VIRRGLVLGTAAAATAMLVIALLSGPAGASPPGAGAGGPPLARPGVISAGLTIELTPAAATSAALACAAWASRAGFANDGRRGHLVVAVAIGMAESGCSRAACFNDTTHRECSRATTWASRDSIDRGPWQINSHYWKSVSNGCAYRGRCAARVAYRRISEYGTYFRPWTTFLTGAYRRYLGYARTAVADLRGGTLTSALIGSCAAYPNDNRHAVIRLANCGSGAADQIWTRSGTRLRTRRGLCLGAESRRSGLVSVQRCTGARRQQWLAGPGSALYNRGTGRCLTDPGGSIRPGHALRVGTCLRLKDRAWYLP
jgi:Lysozyme like domain/Ricin-type beta-trefoil lectin domain